MAALEVCRATFLSVASAANTWIHTSASRLQYTSVLLVFFLDNVNQQ